MHAGTPTTHDAVVVVPGIMGSELVDAASGRTLWGLADPRWYVSAWTTGESLRALALTDEERSGTHTRVRASRLLRFPAFAPMLAGFAPYTSLVAAVRQTAAHPAAVLEFPYDWRLPVAHNARLLAESAARHLEAWRTHPAHDESRRRARSDPGPARLVLVAHSMGGLLARHACRGPEFAALVRGVVTLGTPFYGAPKAVLLLASGDGSPVKLPRKRVRELASGLPGVYGLLPSYRCVRDGDDARAITTGDVTSLGGDAELADAAHAERELVRDTPLPGHLQVVGAHQPTVQAVGLESGAAAALTVTLRPDGRHVDLGGDGTVPRESAQLPQHPAMPFAQSHGAVASHADAILVVQDMLTDTRTGPWQGSGDLGLGIPDTAVAGEPVQAVIVGAEKAADVSCAVVDIGSRMRVATPRAVARDGTHIAEIPGLPAGLYTVQIQGGGAAPVRQTVMVVPASATEPDRR